MTQPLAITDLPSWVASLSSANLTHCVEAFRAIVARFHVNGFATGEVDLNYRERSSMFVVEWPEAWRKFYLEGMVNRDPILNALSTRRGPFTWSEMLADEALPAADRQSLRIAATAGWEEGLVVPIPRGGYRLGLISLVRARGAFSNDEKAILALISVYFHEHVRSLSKARSFAASPVGMPSRVAECLQHAAQGYSDKLIAGRMGVSPSTAHEYIEIARKRLAAKTRTEAVAVAVSLGIIYI